ncbi:MAG: DUF802 domain-containing protein [Rhodoferax sp.]
MADTALALAGLLGLLPMAWVGWSLAGSSLLGLLITGLIVLSFGVGLAELQRYRRDTRTLAQVLDQLPAQGLSASGFLAQVPPPLRAWVARRLDGHVVAPLAPALVPYLLGLLVMLGMLGTFMGLVVTLGGVAQSLQHSVDLQAIRAALALPIQGLSLAFGTSIAGVCGSAVLGGLSALSRRARAGVAQALEAALRDGPLQPLSHAHQRTLTERALQVQAQALPELVAQLRQWTQEQARQHEAVSQQTLAQQQAFFEHSQSQFEALAQAMDASVRQRLDLGLDALAQQVQPLLARSVAALSEQVQALHERLAQDAIESAAQGRAAQMQALQQLQQSWAQTLAQTSADLQAQWQADAAQASAQQQALLDRMDQAVDTLGSGLQQLHADEQQRARAVVQQWDALHSAAEARLSAQQAKVDQRLDALHATLARGLAQLHCDVGAQLAQWQTAAQRQSSAWQQDAAQHWATLHATVGQQVQALQAQVAQQLEALQTRAVQQLATLEASATQQWAALGSELSQALIPLLQRVQEAPRQAADLMQQLEQLGAQLQSRDQQHWQHSQQAVAAFDALLNRWTQAAQSQQEETQALLAQAAQNLSARSTEALAHSQAGAEALIQARADLAHSAVDLASLRAALEQAAQTYAQASTQTVAQLQQLHEALAQSLARSDDQLAYYVAQAREVIDLSLMSQQAVFEELRAMRTPSPAATAADPTLAAEPKS